MPSIHIFWEACETNKVPKVTLGMFRECCFLQVSNRYAWCSNVSPGALEKHWFDSGYHIDRKHSVWEHCLLFWLICQEWISFPLHEWASRPQLKHRDYHSWWVSFQRDPWYPLHWGAEGQEGAVWLWAQARHDSQYSLTLLTMLNQNCAKMLTFRSVNLNLRVPPSFGCWKALLEEKNSRKD